MTWANHSIDQVIHSFRERHRRHKIVRRHGLILPNRTRSWLAKYTKALSVKNATESRMHTGRFVAFMQLLSGIEFDRIVEGLQYEVDLRKFILKLVFLLLQLNSKPHQRK